jgi:hypothetical protein
MAISLYTIFPRKTLMHKAANPENVDFYKLSKIPPAFSGMLVDWSIGAREITATLLDLIVRGHLDVVGTTVIKAKASGRAFEKKFIDFLYGEKKALSFDELSEEAYKKKYSRLLKIISEGMVDEGIIDKDFQEKMASRINVVMNELVTPYLKPGQKAPKISLNYDKAHPPKAFVLPKMPHWILILAVLLFVIVAAYAPALVFIAFPALFFLLSVYGISWYMSGKFMSVVSKHFGTTMDWILTEKGRNIKQKSLALKAYMEQYSMVEDRLANELVGHAVAFGLGNKWLGKLGQKKVPILLFFEHLSGEGASMLSLMDLPAFFEQLSTGEEVSLSDKGKIVKFELK